MNDVHTSFKKLSKERRLRLLDNAGVLMGLQLRRIVEQSLEYLRREILSVPDFRTWCFDREATEEE
jgi:hypothetical protein